MGHSIRALISTREALEQIAQGRKSATIIDLHAHLCLMPMVSDLVDDLNGFNDGNRDIRYPYKGKLYFLSHLIEDKAKEASRIHPVAYIETDYAGGVGTQAAIVWALGQVTFNPELYNKPAHSSDAESKPINRALKQLGVLAVPDQDEFHTAGLGDLRSMDEWEPDWEPIGRTPKQKRRLSSRLIDIALAAALIGILYVGFATLTGTYSHTALFPLARLELAKARWEAANIHDYRLTVRFFNQQRMCEYTTTIKDGRATSVDGRVYGIFDYQTEMYANDPRCDDGTELTVESLFDLVESSRNTRVWFSWQGYVTRLISSGCKWWETYTIHCLFASYQVTNFEMLQDSH